MSLHSTRPTTQMGTAYRVWYNAETNPSVPSLVTTSPSAEMNSMKEPSSIAPNTRLAGDLSRLPVLSRPSVQRIGPILSTTETQTALGSYQLLVRFYQSVLSRFPYTPVSTPPPPPLYALYLSMPLIRDLQITFVMKHVTE